MEDILVDVICNLPDRESRTFGVSTSERNTVAGLIRKACKDNRIPMRSNYVMRDSHNKQLQWSQTLINCGVKHGDVLNLTQDEDDVHVGGGCRWNSWWFVAAISLLIGGVGITAISVLFTRNGQIEYQYGVVMDAGSSHTKLFVYKWEGEKLHETAVAKQMHECPVPGKGITSYESTADNLTALTAALRVCLNEARDRVPKSKHKTTPVFLGATAGMRMLNIVNPVACEKILEGVRNTIQGYPFSFSSPETQARIISGQEEGTFGWVTANYVSGKLGSEESMDNMLDFEDAGDIGREIISTNDTVGALDMGGASTQITFYTPDHASVPADYKEDLLLYGSNYSVYTHSYLCYGVNEAIRRYQAILVHAQGYNETNITNPCGPEGNTLEATYTDIFEAPCANQFAGHFKYLHPGDFGDKDMNYTFVGVGNETWCAATVRQLFNFSAPCPEHPCTFNGTFQPHVQGDFYAFSSFFYEMDFLNLTKNSSSLSEFQSDLTKLCDSPWSVVETMKAGNNGTMLPWYCFEGHYISTLLVEAYKFDDSTWGNIQFVQKINKTDIGWTLGYMLNSSYVIPTEGPVTFISTAAFSALTVLFAIFIILSIGFGIYARNHQKNSTQGLYQSIPTYGAV